MSNEDTYEYGPQLKPDDPSKQYTDKASVFSYYPVYVNDRKERELFLRQDNFPKEAKTFASNWFPQVKRALDRFSGTIGSSGKTFLLIEDLFLNRPTRETVTDVYFRKAKIVQLPSVIGKGSDPIFDRTPLYRVHIPTNTLFKYIGNGGNFSKDTSSNWKKIV